MAAVGDLVAREARRARSACKTTREIEGAEIRNEEMPELDESEGETRNLIRVEKDMGTQILRDGGSCHIHPLVSSAITVSFVLPLFPARFPFPSPSPLFSLSLSLNGFLPASDEYKEPQIHHYYCKMFGYRDRDIT